MKLARLLTETEYRDRVSKFADSIPMPEIRQPMVTIRLIDQFGGEIARIDVKPEILGVVGPDTIRRGDSIFIRKTHDVYLHATCMIVPE